jgi:hypothetical protein
LHQVETHGQERDPEEEVERTERNADRCSVDVFVDSGVETVVTHPFGGDQVAEAYGGESDEAEVGGVQQVPVFPRFEEERSGDDVADHQENAQPDGHRSDPRPDDLVVVVFVLVDEFLVGVRVVQVLAAVAVAQRSHHLGAGVVAGCKRVMRVGAAGGGYSRGDFLRLGLGLFRTELSEEGAGDGSRGGSRYCGFLGRDLALLFEGGVRPCPSMSRIVIPGMLLDTISFWSTTYRLHKIGVLAKSTGSSSIISVLFCDLRRSKDPLLLTPELLRLEGSENLGACDGRILGRLDPRGIWSLASSWYLKELSRFGAARRGARPELGVRVGVVPDFRPAEAAVGRPSGRPHGPPERGVPRPGEAAPVR